MSTARRPPGARAKSAGHSFGEEGGRLTYGGYLRVPELLALQVPQSDPPAHDELLFITVHQVYELWFQQVLYELAARIKAALRSALSPRHVPDEIHQVPGIPRTLSGKKLEVPVRKILLGTPVAEAADPDAIANPEVLALFARREPPAS